MSVVLPSLPSGTLPSEEAATPGGDSLTRFDFRRPSSFSREHVRALEVAHEVFVRRTGSGLSNTLRAVVQLEPLSVEQMSYDEYIRSMPNPTVLTTVALPPLPGAAVVELNVPLALVLVDRLLGGKGTAVSLRRPTEVETYLIRQLMQHPLVAFRETLEPLLEVAPEIGGIDYNPQLVQVVAPAEVVLVFSYRVSVSQGAQSEGLLTLCYPYSTLAPAMDRLSNQLWVDLATSDPAGGPPARGVHEELPDVQVTLSARLNDTTIPGRELAGIRAGDVLRLDHRVADPVRAHVGGTDVLLGHPGRRGRRLALQIIGWQTPARPPAGGHERAGEVPSGPDATGITPQPPAPNLAADAGDVPEEQA